MDLGNKVVVITGGSQGFGKALAQAFPKAGSRVLIASNDEATLNVAAHELRWTALRPMWLILIK